MHDCDCEIEANAIALFAEQGSPTPGLMHFMTYLSKPFRHLEKYPAATQEIEQHLEDDHPDRGDTQRSIGFYKSVAVSLPHYAV